jgi:repressor of nif and glnA expression
VDPNKIGLILIGGLNPVAAAQESGWEAENHCMSTMVDYQSFIDFNDLLKRKNIAGDKAGKER